MKVRLLILMVFADLIAFGQTDDDYSNQIQARLDSIKKAQTGKVFDLTGLKKADGKPLLNADFIGKPTWINFWFTTCRPCIDEMPVLDSIGKLFAGRANFLSITYEPKEKVDSFFSSHKFEFIHITNAKAFIDKIGFEAFPINMFVDKDGRVAFITNGISYTVNQKNEFVISNGEDLIKMFEKLL